MREDIAADSMLIVVPCLNEEAHLSLLLPQLLKQAGDASVVVADGGSVDRSRDIVQALSRVHRNLILMNNPGKTQSAAVNLAVRVHGQKCRWLLRVDAHAIYPDDFIQQLIRAAAERNASSVVVPMITRGHGCFQKAAAAAQNSVLGTGGALHRSVGPGGWVDHGHHALMDLTLFMQVGGYDEGFVANEDAEFDRRLISAGGRIWLEPKAMITYFPRKTAGRLFRQYRNYGRGRARNLRRHPVPVRLRQMLPLMVTPAVAAATLGLVMASRWPEGLLMALPAFLWLTVCLVGGVLLGLEGKCWCKAFSGFPAAIMHMAWSLGFVEEALDGKPVHEAPSPLVFSPPIGQDCSPEERQGFMVLN